MRHRRRLHPLAVPQPLLELLGRVLLEAGVDPRLDGEEAGAGGAGAAGAARAAVPGVHVSPVLGIHALPAHIVSQVSVIKIRRNDL